MPFQFRRLQIPEVVLVEAQSFEDSRGAFAEVYRMSEFEANGIRGPFVQDNRSRSSHGVLRGLHYQKHPRAQGKLVMALRGTIFDVAVDIRKHSPTYGRWIGMTLSHKRLQMLYVPIGFAHGFCVLSREADVAYKVTCEYAPELERGILWSDPAVGIRWPIARPILSPKDARLPVLQEADNNFETE